MNTNILSLTTMDSLITTHSLIAENNRLKHEIKNLNGKIRKLQDDQGYTICKYFNSHKSLQETAEQYCFDNVKDCYNALVYYFDSETPCKSATDYIQYYSEIFGREYKENEEDEDEEDAEDDDNEDEDNDTTNT